MLYAAASVRDAPKPTMVWYVVAGSTVMTDPLPELPKETLACRVNRLVLSGVVSQTLAEVAAARELGAVASA